MSQNSNYSGASFSPSPLPLTFLSKSLSLPGFGNVRLILVPICECNCSSAMVRRKFCTCIYSRGQKMLTFCLRAKSVVSFLFYHDRILKSIVFVPIFCFSFSVFPSFRARRKTRQEKELTGGSLVNGPL